MAYNKTVWVNDSLPAINAGNLNKIEQGIYDLYEAVFPIGQIVIKGDNKDYSNWLGFTWERTAVGKVLVGYDTTDSDFNTIGKTGGEKTHTLITAEMPNHDHKLYNTGGSSGRFNISKSWSNTMSEDGTQGASIGYEGGGQPHNNLQPYQVVAYWKRIA